MDLITINLEFGSTKLEMSFEPTKANVVALFAFINSQMSMTDDNAKVIAGLAHQLKKTTDETEKAIKENS